MSENHETPQQQDDDTAIAGGPLGKLKALLKKPLYLAIAGGLLLVLVAGIATTIVVTSKRSAEKAKAAAIARKEAAAAEKLEAETRVQREEAHKAHQQVLEGVMKAADPSALPGSATKSGAEDAAAEIHPSAGEQKPEPVAAKTSPAPKEPAKTTLAEPAPTAKAPTEKTLEKNASRATESAAERPAGRAARSGNAPAENEAKPASPAAAGSCTLTGTKGSSFGDALGKCLEEFNRLDGRDKPAPVNPPAGSGPRK